MTFYPLLEPDVAFTVGAIIGRTPDHHHFVCPCIKGRCQDLGVNGTGTTYGFHQDGGVVALFQGYCVSHVRFGPFIRVPFAGEGHAQSPVCVLCSGVLDSLPDLVGEAASREAVPVQRVIVTRS
jgi:hypothetical protein